MTEKNLQTARAFLDAFQAGDAKKMLGLMTNDVDFTTAGDPARIPWAGHHKGLAAAEGVFNHIDATVVYEDFQVLDLLASGDKVVSHVRERWRVKATGKVCEQEYVVLGTLRDGKFARLRTFEDTAAEQAAFTR